ncbi:MAG: methionine--tRNA ligase [bacterium]|nr:methionine--tRNA ligase [bacterium]
MFGKKKKFYLTTTLPYVNAEPHIGFALEIIQADVIARFHRNLGEEVVFNFGTDEHGIKIYRKAAQEGKEVQAYVDEYAAKFDNLKKALNVSYTHFIRTTSASHKQAAQEFWKRCLENGDIYKKQYKVKYCVGCELEKTDSELENGKCPIHPNLEIELIEEENYFFAFSKYQQPLLDFYDSHPGFVVPEGKFNEIKSFVKEGLQDFSISRLKSKMPWGVDVPGDADQVMYVWFDALISYISTLGWPSDGDFKKFWPGLQLAGKDNLRQQSAIWQAMLLSAKLPNSTQIFIHGFMTVNGQKISKSLGNVISPFEVVQKYGTDALRYYLLAKIHPFEDSDFSYEKFEESYNSDLAGGIGNLLARTVTLAAKDNFAQKKPAEAMKKAIDTAKKEYEAHLQEFKFNEALKSIWELISFCDKYINAEKPWEGKENASQVISDVLFALESLSDFLAPFLPETTEKIKKAMESKKSEILFPRLPKLLTQLK